jgi:hypothetical protein
LLYFDARVSKAVFHNVPLHPVSNPADTPPKTRILVTHALHLLRQVDYIYTLVDRQIAQQGTYAKLVSAEGVFTKFIVELVNKEEGEESEGAGAKEEEKTRPTNSFPPSSMFSPFHKPTDGCLRHCDLQGLGAILGAYWAIKPLA